MKFYFTLLLCMVSFSFQGFGQTNPVVNLIWNQYYENQQNYFVMEWEAPEEPHDELLGYNIYREDELFIFVTETTIFSIEEGSNCGGMEFLFYNSGQGFTANVTAVYAPHQTESDPESVEVGELLLGVDEHQPFEMLRYPNPTTDYLHIPKTPSESIKVFDLSGKLIKEFEPTNRIDVSFLPSGYYFLQLISNDTTYTDKFIVY